MHGSSAVEIRLRVVDGHGDPVTIMLMGDDKDPKFVADVTDYGVPVVD